MFRMEPRTYVVITISVNWERAKRAIAEVKTIDEIKSIRDKAEAARAYAKQAGESLELQNDIAEVKIRCERRAGEILGDMNGAQGKRTDLVASCDEVTNPTLPELGITRSQSSRWQSIAALPQEEFDTHIEETKEKGAEFASRSTALGH